MSRPVSLPIQHVHTETPEPIAVKRGSWSGSYLYPRLSLVATMMSGEVTTALKVVIIELGIVVWRPAFLVHSGSRRRGARPIR